MQDVEERLRDIKIWKSNIYFIAFPERENKEDFRHYL